MGGNALKNITTRRYQKDEYVKIRDKTMSLLKQHPLFQGRRLEEIPSYAKKDTFGDIDILIESDGLGPHTWETLYKIFDPAEMVRNGDVTSLNVEELQVDLIMTPKHIFNMRLAYYSYNDLGNLIGRIAYKMGLKYGHQGLCIDVYSKEHDTKMLDSVVISTEPDAILECLGYDPVRWHQGFNTPEDIYQYVVSSPFFNAEFYDLEKRTYKARIRDSKRTTYNGFLTWLSLQENVPSFPVEDLEKLAWARVQRLNPNVDTLIQAVYAREAQFKENHSKFNGPQVSVWLNKEIQTIGPWMSAFAAKWKDENSFQDWLTKSSKDDVKEMVLANKDMVITPKVRLDKQKVKEWTNLTGSALNEFLSRFPQQWLTPNEYGSWLKQQTPESLQKAVLEHLTQSEKYTSNVYMNNIKPNA